MSTHILKQVDNGINTYLFIVVSIFNCCIFHQHLMSLNPYAKLKI